MHVMYLSVTVALEFALPCNQGSVRKESRDDRDHYLGLNLPAVSTRQPAQEGSTAMTATTTWG
jgi:hypothetical protein